MTRNRQPRVRIVLDPSVPQACSYLRGLGWPINDHSRGRAQKLLEEYFAGIPIREIYDR